MTMNKQTVANNPAGRLLRICKLLRGITAGVLLKDAWAQVVGTKSDDTPVLLRRIGVVIALVDETEHAIRRLDGVNHELFLKWRKPVVEAFSRLNLVGENLTSVHQFLSPDVIMSLEYCDHELSRRCPERTIDAEALKQLLNEIKSLLDDVMEAELPPDIKAFILDKLDALQRAIEMYQFTGLDPVQAAVDGIIGTTIRQGKDHYDNTVQTDVGNRFWDVCSKAASLVTLAQTGQKLLDWVRPFIT